MALGRPGIQLRFLPLADAAGHLFSFSRMWLLRTLLLLVLLCVGTNPLTRAADSLIRYEASHQAMGTTFTVVAYGSNGTYMAEVATQVFQEIDDLDDQMSNYKLESEVSSINREAFRHSVIVEPRLFKLIQDSLQYSQASGGAFDITVGPLMKAWGFFRGRGRLPSSSELAEVLTHVGYEHVKLDPATRTIRFDEPGIEIDLGAIAKGYAVDQAVRILRADGIADALISSGTSSVYALGSPPGENGWRISVRNPLDQSKAVCTLRLQNLSLSVSGDYEKFFKLGGKIYAHIMDPHTGMPVENMLSAVVVSPSATDSDALSTSFFVEGPVSARKYLRHHPNLTAILLLPTASGRALRQIVLKSSVTEFTPGVFVRIVSH